MPINSRIGRLVQETIAMRSKVNIAAVVLIHYLVQQRLFYEFG